MKADDRKRLLSLFRTRLGAELPDFTEDRNTGDASGRLVFVKRIGTSYSFFIVMYVSPKSYKDAFMVEIAASTSGTFPRNEQRELHSPKLVDFRFRLPMLWQREWVHATEPWWWLRPRPTLEEKLNSENPPDVEISDQDLRNSVDDAITKIKELAIPFCERWSMSSDR